MTRRWIAGVEHYDLEDLLTASDPEFWKMIEERRRSPGQGMTLEAARKHFADKDAGQTREVKRARRGSRPQRKP